MSAFYKDFVLECIGALGLWICKANGAGSSLYIVPAAIATWGMIGVCYNSILMDKRKED